MKRRISGLLLAALIASVPAGCGGGGGRTERPPASSAGGTGATAGGSPTPSPAPTKPAELPLGGRTIFPAYRVVAFYGSTGGGALGVLGEEPPEQIALRLRRAASPFGTPARRVQIAFELIVRIADRHPGPHGVYSHSISPAVIRRYLAAARRAHALLILDIQPGRLNFLDAVRPYRWALAEPDVGIALDPEWRVTGDDVPGRVIGQAPAAEINQTSAFVAEIVRAGQLPEKLFLLHQFRRRMLPDVARVLRRPGLAMVQHVDGFGTRAEKDATYAAVRRPWQFHLGYKLFYDEDVKPYQPAEVLTFGYPPEYVSYQ